MIWPPSAAGMPLAYSFLVAHSALRLGTVFVSF